MIEFYYHTDFSLTNEIELTSWIENIISKLGFRMGDIEYNFVDDDELYELNVEYLNHDTLTDIISFDYSLGDFVHGEIFISLDRVRENAFEFGVDFLDELHRVMIHGILHYCGINDETEEEAASMRLKENWALNLLKVE